MKTRFAALLIDRETDLVTQWAYYEKNSDDAPKFTRPWSNWTQMGDIKISMGRGRFDVVNVHVSKDPTPAAFTAPAR